MQVHIFQAQSVTTFWYLWAAETSCPQKMGLPINPFTKTSFHLSCLPKSAQVFSQCIDTQRVLQGKLKYKFAVHRPPFFTFLNLWLIHCVLYFLFFHRRMKYLRLLYNYHGTRVYMQKCYHGAAETLQIHSFTSSVETYLGVPTHSLFAQVLRETWVWHRENQTSLLIMVNGSCICWSLWGSSCLWIAAINIYGGYAYWGKKRMGTHWEESRLQQFYSYHIVCFSLH